MNVLDTVTAWQCPWCGALSTVRTSFDSWAARTGKAWRDQCATCENKVELRAFASVHVQAHRVEEKREHESKKKHE